MKKIISLLTICVLNLLLFTGCGVEGATQATGIEFVRDVFYVDYNVSTFLDYKVYPSTAENVYVTYDIEADYNLEDTFEFKNGAIKITDKEDFTSIIVKAKVNTFEDSCEVQLKKYPKNVSLGEDVTIDAGLVKFLDLKGEFDTWRSCESGEFVYKVTSTNPSVIEVVSEEDLIVRSTGRKGESEIKVSIYNSNGQEMSGLNDSIKLTVVESIDTVFANFGNKFVIKDGQTKELVLPAGGEDKISVRYFSEKGFLIELANFDVLLSNNNVFEVVTKADGVYLKLKDKDSVEVDGDGWAEVSVTLRSRTTDVDGQIVKLQTTLYVRFL